MSRFCSEFSRTPGSPGRSQPDRPSVRTTSVRRSRRRLACRSHSLGGGIPAAALRAARRSCELAPAPPPLAALLEFDGCAGAFQLRLRLLGVFLRDLLEDGLRCAVDEVLGLFEAEARER